MRYVGTAALSQKICKRGVQSYCNMFATVDVVRKFFPIRSRKRDVRVK